LERRSISIEPELHSKILKFRAFFMSHGIDVDYTEAINFLALHGYDELMKSGFDATLLERLDGKAASDEAVRKLISNDWLNGRIPSIQEEGPKVRMEGGRDRASRPANPPRTAISRIKTVSSRCVKCREVRQMKDPHIETMRNGRQAVRGTCPVCGSKMVRLGIPR